MANGLFDPSSLYQALQQRNLLPTWTKLGGSGGEYDYATNRLRVSPENKGTMAHEMAHAAQYNLLFPALQNVYEKQRQRKELTTQEKQFLDAMSKIMLMGNYTGKDIQNTSKPDELYFSNKSDSEKANKAYNTYRTSLTERQAFGVGNMSVPGKTGSDTGGLHYDPTMASEFSILMSLYDSLPETVKKQAENTRMKEVQQAREKKPNKYQQYPFIETVDVFANPFPPSIK